MTMAMAVTAAMPTFPPLVSVTLDRAARLATVEPAGVTEPQGVTDP